MSARSIHTIKMVIARFYSDDMEKSDQQITDNELSKLEHALV